MALGLVLARGLGGDCRYGHMPAPVHPHLDSFWEKKIHSMAGSP